MTVIVNADDFGLDKNRTDAILEAFRHHWITHATCMVNMPYCHEAMRRAVEAGVVDRIGLHLNITEGFALSDAMRSCRTFCNDDGKFNQAFMVGIRKRVMLSKSEKHALEAEMRAQIKAFLLLDHDVCRHADSHHHVHFDWSIATAYIPLLREFGFNSVRLGYNMGRGRGALTKCYRGLFNCYARRRLGARCDLFGAYSGLQHFVASHRSADECLVEVMVHPMTKGMEVMDGDNGVPLEQIWRFINTSDGVVYWSPEWE